MEIRLVRCIDAPAERWSAATVDKVNAVPTGAWKARNNMEDTRPREIVVGGFQVFGRVHAYLFKQD